jgi:DNA-binding MarR family transcriptional regulator
MVESVKKKEEPSGAIGFLLSQLGSHSAAKFAERLEPLDLGLQHVGVLRLLSRSSGISQRELGDLLGVFPSRLVVLLDELEKRGFVERRDDEADRRLYSLHLTDAGERVLREIGALGRVHNDALCAPLSKAERAQLARLLRRMADAQGLTPGVHPGFRRR